MKLTSKITLMLACVTIAMAGVNYVALDATVSPSFAELEHDAAVQNTNRVSEAIERETEYLSAMVQDWAYWTDSYDFAQGDARDYVEQNLIEESLTGLGLNSLFVIDRNGKVLWGLSLDLESEEEIDIAEMPRHESWATHPLNQKPDANEDSLFAGLMRTDHGIMAVASAPILTSESQGPSVGTMVFGKLLTESVLEEMAAQVSVAFEIIEPSAAGVPQTAHSSKTPMVVESSQTRLSGYQVLRDVTGTPISVIKSETPRDITRNGQKTLMLALGLLIVAGLVGILAVAIGVRVIALKPLRHLADTVLKIGHTGDLRMRSQIERSDEIGTLARQFDETLDELTAAREAMREQSYYTGVLEMSAGLMHNLRNSLNPVKTGIWAALEILRQNRMENFNRAIKELSEMDVDADRRRKLFEYVGEAASVMSNERETLIERIQTIGSETDAIAKILDQQNNLNRPDLHIEKVDLRDVLDRANKQVPEESGIILDVVCDDEKPMVRGNQILLSQVVENVVLNAVEAIQATGREHGTIKMCASFDRDAETPSARIKIKDDGDGIPADLLQKIFERGFSTRKAESGGLGLHWCANTLIAMGGKIAIDSDGAGQGTTVQIDLKPVIEQEQGEAA